MNPPSELVTRRGSIPFPAYVPVTTFGDRFPLDDLIRPYLRRLAPAVMVSAHYARQMTEAPDLPVLMDSGGFAALFEDAVVVERRGVGVIERPGADGEKGVIEPRGVLELQERLAEVAFTLDFPIPPGLGAAEAERRLALTVANARWALENRRRRDLPLYGCVQGWDPESAGRCAREMSGAGFDGLAIGGLVPRARDPALVDAWVDAVRSELPDGPLHVFGLGEPAVVRRLFERGVQSVDSSSYVRLAASGRSWGTAGQLGDPSPTERLHLALCNLAAATGAALPLSAAPLVFRTSLVRR